MQYILYNPGGSNISTTAWRSALNLAVNCCCSYFDQHLLAAKLSELNSGTGEAICEMKAIQASFEKKG